MENGKNVELRGKKHGLVRRKNMRPARKNMRLVRKKRVLERKKPDTGPKNMRLEREKHATEKTKKVQLCEFLQPTNRLFFLCFLKSHVFFFTCMFFSFNSTFFPFSFGIHNIIIIVVDPSRIKLFLITVYSRIELRFQDARNS